MFDAAIQKYSAILLYSTILCISKVCNFVVLKNTTMILITGATGHFGTATINFLLKKGVSPATISGLVRNPDKAAGLKEKGINIKTGDYNEYASLVNAFKNVNQLLLVSGNDITRRKEQQASAVKAAKEAGVKHILYTSFERKSESVDSPIAPIAQSHLATEKFIIESGIPYTILRNNLYMDYVPMFLGEKVLETGVFWPAGNGKLAAVTREDMAEAAANVLTGSGHENKSYHISAPENFSLGDVATILSEVSGKAVPYLDPLAEDYKKALQQAGVPAEYIGVFAGFAEATKQGEFDATSTDLEKLLGRKPLAINEFLQSVYDAGK
jgi:NAD(P)H dehydrogenase (quinone)